MKFVHILNLDTVGGVEELFIHFLRYANSNNEHHILITSKTVHSFFIQTLKDYAHSFHYARSIWGCRLPKFLVRLRKKYILNHLRPDRIVLWNRFDTIYTNTSCPIIYYEHGASWVEKKGQNLGNFFTKVIKIIANSDAARNILLKKWNIDKDISVIQNPLRPDILPATEPKTLVNPFRIGFIGRLIDIKAPQIVLYVSSILKQRGYVISTHIAGTGECIERMKQYIKELDIEDTVSFHGVIRDVENFYKNIEVLLIPSIREPLGLVAQEAALQGCPVIATAVDGLPEVVKDKETGFCIEPTLPIDEFKNFMGKTEKLPDLVWNPNTKRLDTPHLIDPIKIADAIEYLILNPEILKKMSSEAIQFAQKRPTLREYAQILEKELTKIGI